MISVKSLYVVMWVSFASFANMYASSPHSFSLISAGYARNYPTSKSLRLYSPGNIHPVIGYQYISEMKWSLGLKTQFKFLKPNQESRQMALWSVVQETYRMIRLRYPTYALLGFNLYYFMPVTRGVVPIKKTKGFQSEVGAGVSLGLLHIFTDKIYGTFLLNRWRGTATNHFHAWETSISLAYQMN